MTKAYFISGLAADRRIFRNIRLPLGYEAVYLDWITPQPRETLEHYALRMADGRITDSEPFILIGLSMGGMVAAELARIFHPKLTILISSVPVASELPPYFRWAARLGVNKWMPVALVKNASLAKRLFTTETPDDKAMLRTIIRESDNKFIRWSMGAILQWKNEQRPSPYVHLHGSRDELLPARFTRPTHLLKGAGHLLVMNRSGEINALLQALLGEKEQ